MIHTILFVDDEQNILNSLERLFEDNDYRILTATSGEMGLKLLQENKDVSLIVSDFRMPLMDGVEFLKEASAINNNALRIMLTGYADIEVIIEAINTGKIFRFISKPWNNDEFPLLIQNLLDHYEILIENKKLNEITIEQNEKLKGLTKNLQGTVEDRMKELDDKNKKLELYFKALSKSFFDTVKLISQVIEMANHKLGQHSKNVAKIAVLIAKKMDLPFDKIRDIEISGLLHDIGKMNLPVDTLFKSTSMLTNEQKIAIKHHPENGSDSLSSVTQLKKIANIILNHHEAIDGSGYPSRKTANEIPLEAKIISVANHYDNLTSGLILGEKQLTPEDALTSMQKSVDTLFDAEIATHLKNIIPDLKA